MENGTRNQIPSAQELLSAPDDDAPIWPINDILRVETSFVVVDALPRVADRALLLTSLAKQTGLQILSVDSVATDRVSELLLRWFTMTEESKVSIKISAGG